MIAIANAVGEFLCRFLKTYKEINLIQDRKMLKIRWFQLLFRSILGCYGTLFVSLQTQFTSRRWFMVCAQHTRNAESVNRMYGGLTVLAPMREAPKIGLTPWGRAQHAFYLDGRTKNYVWVGTSGHGGVGVDFETARETMTRAAVKRGKPVGDYRWYEEDNAFAIMAWENPHLWTAMFKKLRGETEESFFARKRKELLKILSTYHLDYLEEIGQEPDSEAARIFRARQLDDMMRQENNPDLITAALGSWYTGIEGVIEVKTADGKSYLVKKESYNPQSGHNLLSNCELVDPNDYPNSAYCRRLRNDPTLVTNITFRSAHDAHTYDGNEFVPIVTADGRRYRATVASYRRAMQDTSGNKYTLDLDEFDLLDEE